MPPEEGARLSRKIDAVTLHALASLSETPSLPPSAAELISLSVLHSCVGLPTGLARFLATPLAFYDTYVMGVEDDDQGGRPPENERFTANVNRIAASLEGDYPSFEQVRDSPVIGRLTERLIYFIDEERDVAWRMVKLFLPSSHRISPG